MIPPLVTPVADLDVDVYQFHVTKHTMSMYAGQHFEASSYDHDMQVYIGMVGRPDSRFDDCSAFSPREIFPLEWGGVVEKHWVAALRMKRHHTTPDHLKVDDYIDLWDNGSFYPIERIERTVVGNTGMPMWRVCVWDHGGERYLRGDHDVLCLASDERLIQEWYEVHWLHDAVTEVGYDEWHYDRLYWKHHEQQHKLAEMQAMLYLK